MGRVLREDVSAGGGGGVDYRGGGSAGVGRLGDEVGGQQKYRAVVR